jgi:hypothetical protein
VTKMRTDDQPFAVVVPDPNSRGRWLFYVGDVFIDDTHTGGDGERTDPALRSFREKASAINAAVTGAIMPSDQRGVWAAVLDSMLEKGGEQITDTAKKLALLFGIELDRLPELAPRPAPPPPPLDIMTGAHVRMRAGSHEFTGVVTRMEPIFRPSYDTEEPTFHGVIRRRGLTETRVEITVVEVHPAPGPTERVDLLAQAGVMTPNEARQLLDLASFDDPAVTETVTAGASTALEVRLQCSSSPRTWAAAAPNPAPICELEAGHEGMCRAGAMAWVYSGGEAVLVSPGSTS